MKKGHLGDFFLIKGGKRLPKGSLFSIDKTDHPYLRVTDFQRNSLNTEKLKYINSDIQKKIERYIIETNDVYISIAGTIGICGLIPKELNGANLTENAAKIKPKEGVDVFPKFLSYYLNSNEIQQIIKSKTMAVGVPKLALFRIQEIPINLPPLNQQKHIAKVLDTADAYRQKTKALIAKYDELTQSLFLDMFGDPVSNPMGWEQKELKEITTKIGSGSTPRGGKEAYHTEGISLIRSLNIYDNRFKYKNLAFINDEQADKLKNVIVEENDVLFNITGASICRSMVVPINVLPARVNQHVSIIRPNASLLNSVFISHFLISENVKNSLLGLGAGGGAVMEAITKVQLQKHITILPPLKLQNQFSKQVKLIEQQKATAQQSLQKAEDLFNSLLQKAFKRELV